MKIKDEISFGIEQTFTVEDWWEHEGFSHISDTPFKRQKMQELARELQAVLKGSKIIDSKDIWGNLQHQIFVDDEMHFEVTMDPGSIEVKTSPRLLDHIEQYLNPLFEAAAKAKLVPYRNWWYGVKKGTEGGSHVNMGALESTRNVFAEDPNLVVKYMAFIHNHPELCHGFMGQDVGPGGNAQRMDEKKDWKKLKSVFKALEEDQFATLDELYEHFADTSLVLEKSSFPSLRKMKIALIEDRAQEALRSGAEAFLVCDMRIKILEFIQTKPRAKLQEFPQLHQEQLTSFSLWKQFVAMANKIDLNPVPYQAFFDRQFPRLYLGVKAPKKFFVKEGRRPRKILEVIKNDGGEVIRKKVDTDYMRFELCYNTLSEEQLEFVCEYEGIETQSKMFRHDSYLGFGDEGTSYYCYLDLKRDAKNFKLKIQLQDKLTKDIIEQAVFNLKDMKFLSV